MNSKLLAILALVAMVSTVGLTNSAYASNWTGNQGDQGSFADGNESENPAVADRKDLRPKSFGSDVKQKLEVCGDHICKPGETVKLSKWGKYGGYTERKHIATP